MTDEQKDSPLVKMVEVVEPAEPVEGELQGAAPESPPEPIPAGAKLFVIFFMAIVPILGIGILTIVVWQLWHKVHWFD
jgi:hypothetical protein